VRRGDACIIRCRRGDYLFDGGIRGCFLPAMLRERKIRKLRVAACTSLCAERLGGILDLMDAGFPITEYWLPDTMRQIARSATLFDGDWQGWLHCVKAYPQSRENRDDKRQSWLNTDNDWWLIAAITLLELAHTAAAPVPGIPGGNGDAGNRLAALLDSLSSRAASRWCAPLSGETILDTLTKQYALGGDTPALAKLCATMLLEEVALLPGGEDRGIRSAVTTLVLTAMVAARLANSDTKVRFFATAPGLTEHLVSGHPIKCLNGADVSESIKGRGLANTPEDIMKLIKRYAGHRQSLVYQYGDSNCSVLLCGDSRFGFVGNGKNFNLDRPTVVLAPRQGNKTNERAYSRIQSKIPEQDIWVRSHYSYARKVASAFKEREAKLCVGNCHDYTLQEILLRHNDTLWTQIAGGVCACS